MSRSPHEPNTSDAAAKVTPTTDAICSCGALGCTQMIDPDIDGIDPQIAERIGALETERSYAEMNMERLDDAEEGWGNSLRWRAAEINAEIEQIMGANHIRAVSYAD